MDIRCAPSAVQPLSESPSIDEPRNKYFYTRGGVQRTRVKYVTIDMWEPYKDVAAEYLYALTPKLHSEKMDTKKRGHYNKKKD